MDRNRSLSRREFEDVICRASELAASEPEGDEPGELDEAELFRIAEEVGLPARHVREALLEIRRSRGAAGPVDRVLGPEELRVSRVVPGTPREVAGKLDDFFVDTHLLEPVRRTRTHLRYRPATDWGSKLVRAASSTSSQHHVASADRVEVRLEELEEGFTLVTLTVDPGIRTEYLTGGSLGALAAGGGAGAGGLALLGSAPVVLAGAAAVVAGGGVAAAVVWIVARAHRKKLEEVRAETEGVLDRLETGEGLEPPPPSWRRWVRRQLEAVRREFLAPPDADEDDSGGERR